jgi:hypothetical protein
MFNCAHYLKKIRVVQVHCFNKNSYYNLFFIIIKILHLILIISSHKVKIVNPIKFQGLY